ncbi:MAG: carboxy terminal-processing peptidase [Ferruginibacter sp.]
MNKKFLPVLLVVTIGSFFFAFKSQGSGGNDNPKSRNEKILRNVGLLLEQGHYSPKKIDDEYSKAVLKSFIKDLDDDKTIFLQADIDSFKKFETSIDDEIHGARLESYYAVSESYTRRLNEVSKLYTDLLSKPFDFSKEEEVMLDGDKVNYAATEAARKEVWRKRVKYMVLSKYSDMLDDREKNKNKKASDDTSAAAAGLKFVYKADSTLERESRDQVRRQLGRYFTTLKNHNTTEELFSSFVNAITNEMDPHTSYFAPIESRGFNEMMSGKFYGIGAQLKEEDGKIKVASLVTGGPAWKSGDLNLNDEIVKIGQSAGEPVDVTGYAVTDAVKLIRGAQPGTEVKLTVRKVDGSVKIITLKRDEIKLDDTFAKSAIINGERKIGYIYLPEFYIDFEKVDGARCSEDVAKEIEKLKAENVEGIVMDLRGNGGGSLPEVVKMVGLFIEDGPVCQVKGREQVQPQQLKDRDKSVLYNGPLTVLVDENSASASEIFAAAIQDYKRGVILGSTSTYGKGTVQRTIPLSPETEFQFPGKKQEDLGTVKLTLQKFYRINGGATQLKGVTPDIVIPDRYELLKSREKDNPSSLSWDEISKADFTPWDAIYNYNSVVASANDQVKINTTFSTMRKQIEWIDQQNDKAYSLNLAKYKEEQKELKVAYKQLDSLYKLPYDLKVSNTQPDVTKIANDKEKTERNKQFINRIKNDVYIDESVKVLNNMISQANMALNNNSVEPSKKN